MRFRLPGDFLKRTVFEGLLFKGLCLDDEFLSGLVEENCKKNNAKGTLKIKLNGYKKLQNQPVLVYSRKKSSPSI